VTNSPGTVRIRPIIRGDTRCFQHGEHTSEPARQLQKLHLIETAQSLARFEAGSAQMLPAFRHTVAVMHRVVRGTIYRPRRLKCHSTRSFSPGAPARYLPVLDCSFRPWRQATPRRRHISHDSSRSASTSNSNTKRIAQLTYSPCRIGNLSNRLTFTFGDAINWRVLSDRRARRTLRSPHAVSEMPVFAEL
jgi:hypothetical protein